MVFSDILGHLLNEVKKGQKINKDTVRARKSQFLVEILNKLMHEGFIYGYNPRGRYHIEIHLKYGGTGQPMVFLINRLSKKSRRCFIKLRQIRNHLKVTDNGMFLLTTPYGVLTNTEALKKGTGGELLFRVN